MGKGDWANWDRLDKLRTRRALWGDGVRLQAVKMGCVQPVGPRGTSVATVCRMFQGVLPMVTGLSFWTSLETAGGSVMSRGQISPHGHTCTPYLSPTPPDCDSA